MKIHRLYPLFCLICAFAILTACGVQSDDTSTPSSSVGSTTTTTFANTTATTSTAEVATTTESTISTTVETTTIKATVITTTTTATTTTTTPPTTTTTFPQTNFTSPGKTEIRVHEEDIVIPGLKEEYYFLQITDSHMVICDDAILDLDSLGIGGTPQQRLDSFTSSAGVTAQEFFEEQLAYISKNIKKLDAVFFTGDILDFHTYEANLYLENILNSMPLPYMYVTGNHDYRFYMDLVIPSVEFDRVRGSFLQKMTSVEITVIGVDNGGSLYENGVAERLSEMVENEKNVLLLQHVPLYTPELHDCSVANRGTTHYIGGEGICRNDNWTKVMDLITAKNSPIRAVLAGHLHFRHQSKFENSQIVQYVSPNVHNDATLFHVHG